MSTADMRFITFLAALCGGITALILWMTDLTPGTFVLALGILSAVLAGVALAESPWE